MYILEHPSQRMLVSFPQTIVLGSLPMSSTKLWKTVKVWTQTKMLLSMWMYGIPVWHKKSRVVQHTHCNDPFKAYSGRSIRTDGYLCLRSVECTGSSRIIYCISLGRLRKITSFDVSEGGRRFNDPFDPYGSLSVLTLSSAQFSDRILHLIRET